MRLVTFAVDSTARPGVLVGAGSAGVLDLSTTLGVADMTDLLGSSDLMEEARAAAGVPDPRHVRPVAEVRLEPPVRPATLLCIGYNYRGHGAAGAIEDPEYPDVFAKTPNVVVGPQDDVVLPAVSAHVDYEAELAVVIGRTARAVSPEAALDHVAGYTMFDDVSARDWQGRGSQWVLGKSFDSFGPLGPTIVTPDEVPDVQDLDVELRLNGEVTVRSSTSRMVFPIAFLVSYLSQVVTLRPGDLIATGTPQKLPEALETQRPLRAGDEVQITIGPLGTLTHRFVAPHADRADAPTHHDERRGTRA